MRLLKAIWAMIAETTRGPNALLTKDILEEAARDNGHQFTEPLNSGELK